MTRLICIIQDDSVIEVTLTGEQVKQPPAQEAPTQQTTPKPAAKPAPKKPDTTISALADKQLLRDFLNGEYCLHGVSAISVI